MAPTPNAARAETAALEFVLPADEYRNIPIPGNNGAKLGSCFVKVTDLPETLDEYMEVNPRVPKRTKKDVLAGPVVQGILHTLGGIPEDMAIKNQGIFLLVESAEFTKSTGGNGHVTVRLADKNRHGIVNGGHTYAAIRYAIDEFEDDQAKNVAKAYVRLHILQGIESDKVAEIAEGLNRSKPVDDPSLMNLKGMFVGIQQVMDGKPGADAIAYHQGSKAPMYITEILTFMELFNCERYPYGKHPYTLYRNKATMLRLFKEDAPQFDPETDKRLKGPIKPMDLITPRLPEILRLYDDIRAAVPAVAKEQGFQFGRMKVKGKGKERAGSERHKGTTLPFNGEVVDHRVSNGWVLPMLAAFRANVDWDLQEERFEWLVPLSELLPMVIKELVSVCISQHRANIPPEEVAAKESSFVQCYDKVLLRLALMGKVRSKKGQLTLVNN